MHTRVPPRVQQIMTKKLERSVPGYMKQYIGPYMQQNVVHPSIGGGPQGGVMPSVVVAPPTLHPNTGESWRQNHFRPTNSQTPGGVVTPSQPTPTQPTADVQIAPGQPLPRPAEPYGFITDPEAVPKKQFSPPGAGSLISRVAYVAGGLLILLIVFSFVKGLLSGGSNLTPFLSVAQDQQEIVHLTTNAAQQNQQTALSVTTQNFIATAQLSIASNQTDLISYLAKNGDKIKPKSLGLKLSAATDAQLTTAAANTTYDSTFQSIMNNQLDRYMNDLKQTFAQTKGKNGRTLLSSQYNQAQLLKNQLKG
jgi:hypothetical protein